MELWVKHTNKEFKLKSNFIGKITFIHLYKNILITRVIYTFLGSILNCVQIQRKLF